MFWKRTRDLPLSNIMRIHRHSRILLLSLALSASALPARAQTPAVPLPPAGKIAKPVVVTVAQYRAQRVAARDHLRALAKRSGGGKRDATKIFKVLDKPQIVRRADGQTQRADGTRWSALAAGVGPLGSGANLPGVGQSTFDVKALKREEIGQFERALDAEIAEVESWNTLTNGAYYQSVDANAIIKQLEKSGQIRTGPTWLQARIEAIKQWFADSIENFFKWLASLFPKTAPRAGATIPDFGWLIFVFWALVASLLGYLLFAAYRVFAGNTRWGGRRKKKDDEGFEGEDAELLSLPPDELGERAAKFARDGNYREALRHRYIALLLRLDGRGVWRYDTRRTNWEHIAALRRGAAQNGAAIVAPLSDLTRRFDRVRYGSATCDVHDWRQFESDATSLEARAGQNSPQLAGASR